VINRPYRYFIKRFKGKESLFALLFTFSVILIIIIPAILFFFLLTQESIEAYNKYKDFLFNLNFSSYIERLKGTSLGASLKRFLSNERPEALIAKFASGVTGFLLEEAQVIAKNTGIVIFRLIIMFIGIFFFLRDGEKISEYIRKLLPLEEKTKEIVINRLNETVSAVLIGMIVTAIVQGLLLSVGFLIFGAGYPVLFGAITFVFALLPFGGAVPVWLGGAIYLFLNSKTGAGIGLLIWGALLVSSIDNFLKPILIGEKTHIPFFLLFLSLFGGIMTFGLTGLFLGPILIAILLSLLKVYTDEYQKV